MVGWIHKWTKSMFYMWGTPTKQGTGDIFGKMSFRYHCKEHTFSLTWYQNQAHILLFEMWPFVHKTSRSFSGNVILRNRLLRGYCIPNLTLKEPGFLDPSHSRGGGWRIPPPKISETDWRNIKCVVLVDSYDPPESIGTKKSTNIPCMTPQWRHKWRHVKNTKITKNRQNHGFSLFFQAKVAFFWQWCVSKYAYTCSYSK